MSTVVSCLFKHAKSTPLKAGLIVGTHEITYRELADRVYSVAAYLASLGIKDGDRVVLSASTDPAFVYAYFATHLLGGVCVPLDPNASHKRLGYVVDKTDAKVILLSKNTLFPGRICQPLHTLHDRTEIAPRKVDIALDHERIADILFTSGTTDDAKGVVLSHGAIRAAADHINQFIGNTSEDKEVMPLPLSHSFGLGRLRCNVVKGATIILVPGLTNPGLVYTAIETYKATGLSSVPAGFAVLLSTGSTRLATYRNQLRYIEIGSSTMPVETKRRLMGFLPNTRICMHYGLTEASRSAFIEFHRDMHKLDSVGKPSPGVSIQIVDDGNAKCAAGEKGKILVKGQHCMTAYWQDETRTNDVIKDGWLATGDFGYMDTDGYLYLEARESDIINVGGRKVSPVEIETLLQEHPAVAQCACVGIPDPRGISGKAVKAFMTPVSDCKVFPKPVELAKLLRGKIEPYKMPVAYEWVDNIPKTESGKIKRSALLVQPSGVANR